MDVQQHKRKRAAPRTLASALRLVQQGRQRQGEPWRVGLACGIAPLHLESLLAAELLGRTSAEPIEIEVGLFGDLAGNIERLSCSAPRAVAVVVEWSDLDPRLGFRASHCWRSEQNQDIGRTVASRLEQLGESILRCAERTLTVVALPTLPLPPRFSAPQPWADPVALKLEADVYNFAAKLSESRMIRILNSRELAQRSAEADRFDLRSDLRAGFPYCLEHASALAALLAELIRPAAPRKGIITDLDDTLWKGTVGEVGAEGISWDLDHGSHAHALYQEMLAALVDDGVLVAVASKNDRDVVEGALRRSDLVISPDVLYPVRAHWGLKSDSVRDILQVWNVASDDVVFIDDRPSELAEVSRVFPNIECLQFPTGDDQAILSLLQKLRNLCGKETVTAEDRLRIGSIKRSCEQAAVIGQTATTEQFLEDADGLIAASWNEPDARTLELINKTNQFNLNGRRIDISSWQSRSADTRSFLLTISYRDKFGPLGKIGVVSGKLDGPQPLIDVWVMSCRAFSRRIEYHMLDLLFERLGTSELHLDFAPTKRNGPWQEFIGTLGVAESRGRLVVQRQAFVANCPKLYARTEWSDERTERAA